MDRSLGLLLSVACLSALPVLACSSSSGTDAPGPKPADTGTGDPGSSGGPAAQDETWADGKSLSGSVAVAAGTTVTIAPGATISIAAGTTITVSGKLTGKSDASKHAKLSTSGTWKGIVVASGGSVALDGVDISGADVAIEAKTGATASYDNGAIVGTPFKVGKGGKLTTAHAKVTGPDSSTDVLGSFTASYLDYDENDQHAIIADDPTAVVFIEDSTFKNSGKLGPNAGPDLLTVNDAASFHIAYSDISGAHCGFHFVGGDTIEIDHVTVHQITNGADIWGSAPNGKHTVTASNFQQTLGVAFDESGANGTFTVTGCYVSGTNNLASPSKVAISNAASGAIPDAHPR